MKRLLELQQQEPNPILPDAQRLFENPDVLPSIQAYLDPTVAATGPLPQRLVGDAIHRTARTGEHPLDDLMPEDDARLEAALALRFNLTHSLGDICWNTKRDYLNPGVFFL